MWLGTGFGLGSGYTDCERSFNPVSVPGVRIVPANEAVAKPGTQFQLLQQRAGELFGQAKESVNGRMQGDKPALHDLREQAGEKFNELGSSVKQNTESGYEKLRDTTENSLDHLKDRSHDLAETMSAKTQAARNEVASAIRHTPVPLESEVGPDGNSKVRTV